MCRDIVLPGFLFGAAIGVGSTTIINLYFIRYGFRQEDNDSKNCKPRGYREQGSSVSNIDEEELAQQPTHSNPELDRNYQVITAEEWASDDEVIRQQRETDAFMSKLKGREDMEMAYRRSKAVNSLAHALAEAKDEKACFEVVSRLIVPLFQIDGCCYALVKVCSNVLEIDS
jgi:hypothetical protein